MTDITCDTALERMLEAEPVELRGEVDTELARHIKGCDRCRAVAAAMLEELEALDDALDHLAGAVRAADAADHAVQPMADPMAAADAAADAALAASGDGSDGVVMDVRRGPGRRTGRGRSRWTRAAWVPLAAAAALAAVLLFGRDHPFSGPGTGTTPPAEPTIEPQVAVTPPADKSVAIMETENPNITIVWLYEREGS